MNTREIVAEYRMQRWVEIIKDCKESGLSIKAYCKSNSICENTYFYWQRKIRETVCSKIMSDQDKIVSIMPSTESVKRNLQQKSSESLSPITWAQINTKETNASIITGSNSIKINRDGWTITIETGVDTELLIETLRAVSRACY